MAMSEPVTAEQARAWLEERAGRFEMPWGVVMSCHKANGGCDVISYEAMHGSGAPEGFEHHPDVAAFVKHCPKHAPTPRYAWLRDVPAQAAADYLNKGDAFLLDSMRALLPLEHPEHAA